ncbi:mavicyanin-like [Bidens hawaiensis]|uniref:mavicyanin-like n=1 Tax=Bidens hawaiensis TaxID=980011 RepID=UPI00404ADDCF
MVNKNLGVFILIATATLVTQATCVRAAEDVLENQHVTRMDDVPLVNKHIALTTSGGCTEAKEYFVGDDKGWEQHVDYKAWAAGKDFRVGDMLVFELKHINHNILVVDEDGYNRCCGASRVVDVRQVGKHPIVLTYPGTFGFISNVADDCPNGMKILVTVKAR